jgi:hypothetical protein
MPFLLIPFNVIENKAHFVLKCALHNSIIYKFRLLFENEVLGGLKYSFELDHQVDISLYLTKATALCHYGEVGWFDPIMTYFQSHEPFGILDSKINFVSFPNQGEDYYAH